jgi:type IV secretory pathway VirB2 component (pilin)
MRKFKLLFAAFVISLPLLTTVGVSAQFNPLEPTCSQVDKASEICTSANSTEDPVSGKKSIFRTVANLLTIAAGAIAVVMIIISGITMITSSGDSGKVKKSRDTIIYVVVGIFVVILSRSIVLFIVDRIAP